LRPEVPQELSNVLARMLAKQPEQRFQTPVEVAQALSPFARPGQKIIAKMSPGGASSESSTQQTAVPADTSRMPRARATIIQKPSEGFHISLSEPKKAATTQTPRRRSRTMTWLTAGIALLALLLAGHIVIRVATNKGTIKIELSDPKAEVEVKVDGDTVTLTGLDEPLRLKVGDHNLIVSGKNFETNTQSFTVKRGDNAVLHITLQEKKQAAAGDHPGGPPLADSPAKDGAPNGWISNMPTEAEVARTSFAKYEDGALRITGSPQGTLSAGNYKYQAKNSAIRVVVKKLEGHNVFLHLRAIQGEIYAAIYRGDRTFLISKNVRENGKLRWTQLAEGRSSKAYTDYFEFAFKAEDDLLTIEADGVEIVRARDTALNRAGGLEFGAFQGQALFKKAEIEILDGSTKEADRPPPAPAPTADGNKPLPRNLWITLEPAKAQIYGNGKGRVENGVLILEPDRGQGTSVNWNDLKIHPKNVTIRAKVRVPVGSENIAFTLREDPGEWRKHYALGFGRSDKPGRYDFSLAKRYLDGDQHRWPHLKTVEGLDVDLDGEDYFAISCSAIGDMLSISVNGKRVVEVRDSSYTEGVVGLASWESKVYFKDIEVKIHGDDAAPPNVEPNQKDEPQVNASPPRPPAAPRPQPATGRWERLPAAAFGLWDESRAKVENGVIELHNTAGTAPSVRGKDVIFRARVKRHNGPGQLQLSVRDNRSGSYSAWYDGKKFGVTRWTQEGQKWDVLKECPAPVYRDFIQLSIAAIGDTLTLKVNGKPLLQARDANFTAGDICIGAWNDCRASFKDFEVFIKNK
jgi:hypothetical protein